MLLPNYCLASPAEDLSADLVSKDISVRRAALWKLAHPQSPTIVKAKYTPLLIPIVEEGDVLVKWNAVEALANIGPAAKEAIPALLKKLREPVGPDSSMRSLVIAALAKIGPSDPAVLKALSEKVLTGDLLDADNSAKALGSIGKSGLPYLLPALKAPSLFAPYAAARGIRKIGKDAKAAVPDLLVLASDKKRSGSNVQLKGGNMRNAAMKTLAEIAPKDSAVISALKKISLDANDKPACDDASECLKTMAKFSK